MFLAGLCYTSASASGTFVTVAPLGQRQRECGYAPRSGIPLPPPICVGGRLAHPAAGLHHRACLLHRLPRRRLRADQARRLPQPVAILAADLRHLLRHGRRHRHRHAVSVRHQLEPLLRRRRQHHLAAAGLRRSDRVLPRSDLPRRAAVRPQAGAAGHAFRRRRAGGRRHAVVGVLDPRHQQLDADAGRLRSDRRPVLPEGLVRDRLQPVAAVSLRAYGQRLLRDHRLRRARRRRLHGAARAIARRRPHDAAAGAVVPRHLRADPGRARRPARPEHARAPAGQARGDRRPVGRRQRRARLDHRLARPERRAQHRRDRDPETRQSLSHPFVGRRRQRPEGFPGRSAAAGRDRLFRLPHHGRHRALDAGDGGCRIIPAVAQAAR